eukprot:scpid68513/ scgid3822/ 
MGNKLSLPRRATTARRISERRAGSNQQDSKSLQGNGKPAGEIQQGQRASAPSAPEDIPQPKSKVLPSAWAVSRVESEQTAATQTSSSAAADPSAHHGSLCNDQPLVIAQRNGSSRGRGTTGEETAVTLNDTPCTLPGTTSMEDSSSYLTSAYDRRDEASTAARSRSHVIEQLSAAEARCHLLETENLSLRHQLSSNQLSSSITPTDARVARLEAPSTRAESTISQRSEDESKQTVEAQNKIIASLESQLTTAAEEIRSLREQFTKRLRKQRAKSAELRTEAGITIMTLREENVHLTAENEQLKNDVERLRSEKQATRATQGHGDEDDDSDSGAGYLALVTELSSQVERLTTELRKAQRKIKSLQRPPRAPAGSTPLLHGDAMDTINRWVRDEPA